MYEEKKEEKKLDIYVELLYDLLRVTFQYGNTFRAL